MPSQCPPIPFVITLLTVSLWVVSGVSAEDKSTNETNRPIKILIAVDSEGATGVNEYWARNGKPGTAKFRRYRELTTADVNAAIAGCFAGGADEVYVKDDGFRDKNLLMDLLDKRAKIVPTGGPILNGLDHSFSGVMLVCFHAMEGAKDGVLAHTWSSARRRRYWFNDREGGEVFVYATVAGHDHNVPIVMATGCAGLCREVNELLGKDVVTVAVKSVRKDGSVELPPQKETLPKITASAKRAVQQIGKVKPFRTKFPIRIRLELKDEPTTDGYIKWRRDRKPDWPGQKADKNSIKGILKSTRHLVL